MEPLQQAEQLFLKQSNLYSAQRELDRIVLSATRDGGSLFLTEAILKKFHLISMKGLIREPGAYRVEDVHIKNSPHNPPSWIDVSAHMLDFFRYLDANWSNKSLTHLAGFLMWRLNWIHPFLDGNGRTSRTSAYFVLCAKFGKLIPSRNSILEQLFDAQTKDLYYQALRNCDSIVASNRGVEAAIEPMEKLLSVLLTRQLAANL